MNKALLIGIILAMASLAQADLQVVVEETGTPAAGLTQYTVYLVTDCDDWMTAFSGRFDGPMNQVWFAGVIATPTMQHQDLLGEDSALDTHLLLLPAQMALAKLPMEDGPGTGSYLASVDPNPPNDVINMAIGIRGDYQLTNLPFAQIVVPDGECVYLSGSFGRNDQRQGIWFDGTPGHELIPIPEPATLLLLLGGALPALLRRKSKSAEGGLALGGLAILRPGSGRVLRRRKRGERGRAT